MSDLRVITFDGNNVALYDNGSYVLVDLPAETIIGTVEKCPTSQVQTDKKVLERTIQKVHLVGFLCRASTPSDEP